VEGACETTIYARVPFSLSKVLEKVEHKRTGRGTRKERNREIVKEGTGFRFRKPCIYTKKLTKEI